MPEAPSSSLDVEYIKESNGVLVSMLKGRLDAVTATPYEKEINGRIDAGVRRLVIDFGGLDYISSAGLRVVLATAMRLRALEGALKFSTVRGMVREVFQTAGLIPMFQVEESVQAALKSF